MSPRFINLAPTHTAASLPGVVEELTAGLLHPQASISPKFFYDALGSKLFEAITVLDEYYPTRTEAGIFEAMARPLAIALDDAGLKAPCLIDLGAGNCAKAAALIPHLQPAQYVPVDISADFLQDAAQQIQGSYPTLSIVGVGMDFSHSLQLPDAVQPQERVFFYPGSSLGNFTPAQALQFLQRISNKNCLRHINGLLGADFDVRQWQHVALFNTTDSRIEMHLQASEDTLVQWAGHTRRFAQGDRIHTEHSYKWRRADFESLLRDAGFREVRAWTDANEWFALFLAH